MRDRSEGIKVTDIYYGLSWFTTVTSIILLAVGLRNVNLLLSEKGLYAMSFILAFFSAFSVQKNTTSTSYTASAFVYTALKVFSLTLTQTISILES